MTTFSVLEAYSLLRRELNFIRSSRIDEAKMGYKQMLILNRLMDSEATMGELAEFTLSDKAAMTRMIYSLEKVGWVKRSASAQDKRSFIISLTPKGRNKAKQAREVRDYIGQQFENSLNEQEQKDLTKLLHKVSAGLQKQRTQNQINEK
jgi:DNA-binding MarR family transcriptional regulator